ncbi:YfiT family bacillithiol transferase [Paenibacillus arenilitoris]|uniref:Metal-dependent hydrolase n=1 Tax=Paenibacillus arenilitoris TaxID=2772299 RepID=A0A927H977_9BACL|nr:putative metal-dependent hydrolase [Paenibacillus arenilitoris]MBD2872825.1 putative metal-dependent hydrolase [Paenibacillus arenilitoris]
MDSIRYPIGKFEPAHNPSPEQRGRFIDAIAEFPQSLRLAVQNLTPEQLQTPYRPGGWTVRQVVHHLADNDMNAYIRFKRALTEDNSVAGTYREDLWAELGDYDLPVEGSLVLLGEVRSRFAALLRTLKPADFERTFTSPTHGAMTLDAAVQRYDWHGRHHLAQIRSTL